MVGRLYYVWDFDTFVRIFLLACHPTSPRKFQKRDVKDHNSQPSRLKSFAGNKEET